MSGQVLQPRERLPNTLCEVKWTQTHQDMQRVCKVWANQISGVSLIEYLCYLRDHLAEDLVRMKAFIGPGNGEYRIVPICIIGEAHNVVCRALSSTPGLRNMPCSRIGLKLSNISAIRPATLPFAVQYSSSMRSSMVIVEIESSSPDSELICLSLASSSPLGTSKCTLLKDGQLALEKS